MKESKPETPIKLQNVINCKNLPPWQGDFPRHFSESAWRPFCPMNVYGLDYERNERAAFTEWERRKRDVLQ